MVLPLDLRPSKRKIITCIFCLPDVSGHTEGSLAISMAQREKRLLNGIIQHLLPTVGPSVKSIILAYSCTVSSKMVCGTKCSFYNVGVSD